MTPRACRTRRARIPVFVAMSAGACAAHYADSLAQDEQPSSEGGLTEIVITGSRIPIPNEVSISPVTQIDSNVIAQTGVTRIEDLLNSLPQVFADQGSNVSNTADGTAAVDLRGLGPQRNLVLVNGRRLGPGDPQGSSKADLNEVPVELIQSVEILTGGASSVYGADAVAGVVNFKLIENFEGVKLTGNYAFYSHTNDNPEGVVDALNAAHDVLAPGHVSTGDTTDLGILAGLNTPDKKGNATFYATYRNVASVLQSQYSYSACALGSGFLSGASSTGGKFQCGGSVTSFPGQFLSIDPTTGNVGPHQTIGPHGTLLPFSNSDLYNYGPLNYYQRPDDRYIGGALAHYDFNEHATAYTELQFMKDRTVAQIAPSGIFWGTTGPYPVNCNNPELSASMIDDWCAGSTSGNTLLVIGRRDVEGGGRRDDIEHTASRAVLGVGGRIDDAWQYDASAQYSYVHLAEELFNDLSIKKVGNSLDVVDYSSTTGVINGAGGVPTCTSALPKSFNSIYPNAGTDSACVPWDIFQPAATSAASRAYVAASLTSHGFVTQQILNMNFTGDLGRYNLQIPTASTGAKVNVGAEWREVKSAYDPDAEYQSGDAEGEGGPVTASRGAISVREVFGETHVPIVSDRPLAKSLDFEAGYRFSGYGAYSTNTYKYGLEWAPIRELRFRSSWARAVRAPNIGERFGETYEAPDGATDPCSGTTPQYSLKLCERTGVTSTEFGNISPSPSGTYNGIIGSSPTLQPESATTVSFGIGWSPSLLEGFRMQADYYDIRIVNVIQTIGADVILRQCLLNDLFCNLIHRDTFGTLWFMQNGYVIDKLVNVGELEQKGIDTELSYDLDPGKYGHIVLTFIGTYIFNDVTTPIREVASTGYDCAGYYGSICGEPVPRWRHTARATWHTPWHKVDLSLAWRYFAPVTLDELSPNVNLAASAGSTVANGGISNTDARLSSRSYLDMSLALPVTEKISLRFGINNLLDKDPPLLGSNIAANGNTFPQTYDALGRYIFGTVTATF